MIPEPLLVHLSPLKWEHINLTGDYHWRRDGVACEIGNCDHSGPPLHSPRPLLSAQCFTNWSNDPISAQVISNFIHATVQPVESMIGCIIEMVTPVGIAS
jgi:hypothetical protein